MLFLLKNKQKTNKNHHTTNVSSNAMEYAPDFQHCFVDMYELAIYAKFEIWGLRAVKLFLQRLSHGQEIIMLYKQSNT